MRRRVGCEAASPVAVKPAECSRSKFWVVTEEFFVSPIGVVRSTRSEPDDDGWDRESSRIDLLPPFDARSIRGLDMFSHCIVVYLFDRARWDGTRIIRHPRGNTDWPEVGIFSQRAKDRPNRLGVTVCRITGADETGIDLEGLDAIDGTPVIDIKPWMVEFGPRGTVSQPGWASELMADYW